MARKVRFIDWCQEAPDDERKINYVYRYSNGKEEWFTSEDTVSYEMLNRIRQSLLENASLKGNEWHVVICEI